MNMEPNAPYILTIGDIGITGDWVVTPNGSAPLAGSQWTFRDNTRIETKIPTWAIVVAIITAITCCLLGLLFLLVKEKQTTGHVEISVHSATLVHVVQIPIYQDQQIRQYHALFSRAQLLAQQANKP